MFPHRPLPLLVCALLVVVANSEPALALQNLKTFARSALVVKTEGRKGTRLYVPDDVVSAATEEARSEPTAKEKLDLCMASWDKGTHISQTDWRQICVREIKSNE